jgi:hypothetical protein
MSARRVTPACHRAARPFPGLGWRQPAKNELENLKIEDNSKIKSGYGGRRPLALVLRKFNRNVRRAADDSRGPVRVGRSLVADQRFQKQEELLGEHGGCPLFCGPTLRCCAGNISGHLRRLAKMVS